MLVRTFVIRTSVGLVSKSWRQIERVWGSKGSCRFDCNTSTNTIKEYHNIVHFKIMFAYSMSGDVSFSLYDD